MERMFYLTVTGSVRAVVREQVTQALLSAFTPPLFTQEEGEGEVSQFHISVESCDTPLTSPEQTPYDYRFVWTEASTIEEVIADVYWVMDDSTHRFTSTRGITQEDSTFLSVVRIGLAPDGGLFNMRRIPQMPASQVRYICTTPRLSYMEVAQCVLQRLVDRSVRPQQLWGVLTEAYNPSRWSNRRDLCPITKLIPTNETHATTTTTTTTTTGGYSSWDDMWLLELYHGPTAAFKDFALQLFPRYFDLAVAADHNCDVTPLYMVVAATSGDTGVAAISGFVNACSPTRVLVLYPLHGVSPVQEMQMLSYDNGTSVRVCGVRADFDACQCMVKQLFSDRELAQELWSKSYVRLASANSINWGRLIPQVVYYFWAYHQLVQEQQVGYGEGLDIVVPCGNFGNILAALFAKLMGLPLGKLVVASNCNDVLHEFVQTGHYDVRDRHLMLTASPSIDILKASNVERLLYLLSNGDTTFVREQMSKLETEKHFALHGDMLQRMRETFWSAHCSEVECAATIKEVYEVSGQLLDPHTAVAVFAAKQFRQHQRSNPDQHNNDHTERIASNVPLVIVSTAHWAKFPAPVLHALRGDDTQAVTETGGGTAEGEVNPARACRALYDAILAQCPNVTLHPTLNGVLATAEAKGSSARTLEANISFVKAELFDFVSAFSHNTREEVDRI